MKTIKEGKALILAFSWIDRFYYSGGYVVAYILYRVISDYVFEPFMCGNSILSIKIGKVIGTDPGRGE